MLIVTYLEFGDIVQLEENNDDYINCFHYYLH